MRCLGDGTVARLRTLPEPPASLERYDIR